ncbi:HAD hydrolase-like protein [Patescibacteria group bacterium]|nr:HAD hydrolase-like protein [Patescibacteria group bacterium]MBU1034467.1 HAD hydrolase-like protein [Patescibacteria group bacterium]MBU1629582.1 HAD hydrolase-like protein [Patescibacteria group bacterium]MBU1907688.1 HAD hydrolase-like protein [Patescibacteria group bacterium]
MEITIFFDLDRTLFDTDRMYADICKDLQSDGFSKEEIDEAGRQCNHIGYTFKRHLRALQIPEKTAKNKTRAYYAALDRGSYTYHDVPVAIKRLSERNLTLALLTHGFPRFHQRKFASLGSELCAKFQLQHYVWKGSSKGGVISHHALTNPESRILFVDDLPSNLEAAHGMHPRTKCLHIWRSEEAARPPLPDYCLRIRTLEWLGALL